MTRPEGSALVVGGASGIGAAVVARHRADGLPVTVWDVRGDVDVTCDVTDDRAVAAATAETIERAGVPRWVTVTAGIGHAAPLLEIEPDAWDRVFAVNTRGPWSVLRHLARAMLDAGKPGSFVVTTSVSARLVDRGMAAYCASKAACDMLVRVAAAEWGDRGIRVNAVAPGVTRTPMLPAPDDSPWLVGVRQRTALARTGQPGDVADAVVALHALGWVTGEVLTADGGLSLHSPIDAFGAAPGGTRRIGPSD